MNKAALCFIVALSSSFAQSVSVGDGNVFFRGAAGSVKQITSEHLDSDPSLSFDNKQIVFVRRTPGRQTGDLDENEIWIADCDHFRPAKRILRGRQGNISPGPRMLLAEFSKPQFSPASEQIYFMSALWATARSINILDLRTGAVRFLYAGLDIEVIHDGQYKGYLIATKDPITDHGRIIVYWLLDPGRKEIKRIEENESDLEFFRKSRQNNKQ